MVHVFRSRGRRIDEFSLDLGVSVATYRARPFAGGAGEHQLRGSGTFSKEERKVREKNRGEIFVLLFCERKRNLTVEFPFGPQVVPRPLHHRPLPLRGRLLPHSADELALRPQVVLRLPHRRPLAPRRHVVRTPLPREIPLHSKVVLVVVHRLPVHAFLVEFLAVRGDRVHRLVPRNFQVVLRDQIVGATVSSGIIPFRKWNEELERGGFFRRGQFCGLREGGMLIRD